MKDTELNDPVANRQAIDTALLIQRQRDEAIDALRTFNAYHDDLASSNPGFLGKLTLKDYAQANEAWLKVEAFKRKYPDLWNNT